MSEELTLKERVQAALATEEAKNIKLLIAFLILKTKTEKDDEILDNIDEVADMIAAELSTINEFNPTDKDAKEAGIQLLKKIASLTKTKWDDRALNILDFII